MVALYSGNSGLGVKPSWNFSQMTHLVKSLSSRRGVLAACHSARIGHVLQVLFGTAFSNAKTLEYNNTGMTGWWSKKNEHARCDGVANKSSWHILPFLWVMAPEPSPHRSSEHCFSGLIQPSDKRRQTRKINYFIYLQEIKKLFLPERVSQRPQAVAHTVPFF